MAGRRKGKRSTGRQRGASRGSSRTPAWMWLATGILIGLGLAYYLWAKGYIPKPEVEIPVAGETRAPGQSEPAIAEAASTERGQEKKPRYDFFTVLPEMEVVVPEQELTGSAKPAAQNRSDNQESYLLQVGSFRQSGDAEQMKARLALLGIVGRIQTVTVNQATWHRVRVGPVSGARTADEMRRRLADNGIDSLVMKNP